MFIHQEQKEKTGGGGGQTDAAALYIVRYASIQKLRWYRNNNDSLNASQDRGWKMTLEMMLFANDVTSSLHRRKEHLIFYK